MLWMIASPLLGAILGYGYAQIPRLLDRNNLKANSNLAPLPKSLTMLLDAFEEERLKHKRRSDLWDLILFTLFGAFSWFFFTQLDSRVAKLYFFVLLFFSVIMVIKSRFFRLKSFTKEYKQEVLGGLIAGLDPRLEYVRDKMIPQEALVASGLYGIDKLIQDKTPLTIEGEDHVHGKLDGVDVQISDLEIYKGEGEQVKLVFSGTFMVAEFPTPFSGKSYVLPDFSDAKVLKEMLHEVSNKKTFRVDAPRVDTEDGPFEKVYEVHGTDEPATKRLIDAQVKEQLLALDGRSDDKVQVAVSFCENRMYLGSLLSNLQFEPKLHKPVNRPEDWQYIYTQLGLYLSLIKAISQARKVSTPAE
ncbi:MAG TPA: hypothetical protein DCE41_16960 [Cytophagales bacterium]|nr:hypothetical protein [Cytophagales bacterium]HAA23772.1 hypothetical protein [Cytophagales bacterium]HAP58535.1 hypothetical protein [Cytophagales bacterium]